MAKKKGRKVGLVLGVLVILSGFGYLMYGSIGDSLVFFLTPTELVAKGAAAYDAPARLGGQVVPGSVDWNADALDLRFRLTDGETEVAVRSKGAPPAMFRDTIGVIVEGHYTRAGVFQSTNLMVKHSNEYRAPDGHKPEYVDQTLIRQ